MNIGTPFSNWVVHYLAKDESSFTMSVSWSIFLARNGQSNRCCKGPYDNDDAHKSVVVFHGLFIDVIAQMMVG
jgi:hypothetical protein